jgi:hypothetical protein
MSRPDKCGGCGDDGPCKVVIMGAHLCDGCLYGLYLWLGAWFGFDKVTSPETLADWPGLAQRVYF